MHKSAAWPLSWMYAGLVIYASLYPFAQWRDQGISTWSFLTAPLPRYWSGFDVAINVVGYAPLGALFSLAVLRSLRMKYPLVVPLLAGAVLSLLMEGLQSYLPQRVASKEDWILNTLGAGLGAGAALALERWGVLARWDRVRSRWLVVYDRGYLVLLATWPLALLFPASIPFGVGQVLARTIAAVQGRVEEWGGPEATMVWLSWLPKASAVEQGLSPSGVYLCVLLGLLIPCCLAYCVVRNPLHRAIAAVGLVLLGVATTGFSSALTWGPSHAWAWLDVPVRSAVVTALLLALALVWLPVRASAALVLLALGVDLSILNQAPESPYFSQTLQAWEQGRFIRFNGLAQWLGWIWPYAAGLVVLTQFGRRTDLKPQAYE